MLRAKLGVKASGHARDSAKAGASAVHSAEERALDAELAQAAGKESLLMLWDLQKFFDSVSLQVLVSEARQVDLPMPQLALSSTHRSRHRMGSRLASQGALDEARECPSCPSLKR